MNSKDKAWEKLPEQHKLYYYTIDDIEKALDIAIKSVQEKSQKEKAEIFNEIDKLIATIPYNKNSEWNYFIADYLKLKQRMSR